MPRVQAPEEVGDALPNLATLTLIVSRVWVTSATAWERTVSMNSSNSGRASCGPGAASGWYCTAKIGLLAVAETLDRAVVQIHVRHLEVRRPWNARSRRLQPQIRDSAT